MTVTSTVAKSASLDHCSIAQGLLRHHYMADQTAENAWHDGRVPVSGRFGDPYFSLDDGLAESIHVFLDGNNLPARFVPGFHIAELGFGTGLNMLAAWSAWNTSGQTGALQFSSFEQYPMAHSDAATALAAFPELIELATEFLTRWSPDTRHVSLPGLSLQIIPGDARQSLPKWPGQADAWFLDGFSPAKNPELWGAQLLRQVAIHSEPGGTFATYTAAGHVRRSLASAGFSVTRVSGFGRKRHMTVGQMPVLDVPE